MKLHMPFDVFWDMTPIELDYAFKAYLEEIEHKEQLSWEQVRTDVYYRYLMSPLDKGHKHLPYSDFKRKIFPLSFDKPTDETEEIDFAQIESVFNQLEQKEATQKIVSAEELKAMNI